MDKKLYSSISDLLLEKICIAESIIFLKRKNLFLNLLKTIIYYVDI